MFNVRWWLTLCKNSNNIGRDTRSNNLRLILQVRGVIFDSAPGERRLTTLFKAISAIIGGHPLTNLPMSFVITFFISVLWFFEVNDQQAYVKLWFVTIIVEIAIVFVTIFIVFLSLYQTFLILQ